MRKIIPKDIIPAFAGVIGKIALAAAFAMAWANGFGIEDPSFVSDNVRLELIVASVFTLIFSAFLTRSASPPGTLAPLIPLVPVMVSSGVHPLPLAILISLGGLIFAPKGYFNNIVNISGPGAKAGILLLFGIMGITGSLDDLRAWSSGTGNNEILFVLLSAGVVLYVFLQKLKANWLIIPSVAAAAILVSVLYGSKPAFETGIGLPIIDPFLWWDHKWGIGFGLNAQNFITALPFALLAITIWPIDALAVRSIQEHNYPSSAKNSILDMKTSFISAALRNLTGAILGGAQTSAVWRSFMIPLAVVKRPIAGSALILGILGIAAGLLGYPIDIAIFPSLVWSVLIFGVFAPMLEIGLTSVRETSTAKVALICLVLGIGIDPVIGWSVALFLENFGLISDSYPGRSLDKQDKILTTVILTISILAFILINITKN